MSHTTLCILHLQHHHLFGMLIYPSGMALCTFLIPLLLGQAFFLSLVSVHGRGGGGLDVPMPWPGDCHSDVGDGGKEIGFDKVRVGSAWQQSFFSIY